MVFVKGWRSELFKKYAHVFVLVLTSALVFAVSYMVTHGIIETADQMNNDDGGDVVSTAVSETVTATVEPTVDPTGVPEATAAAESTAAPTDAFEASADLEGGSDAVEEVTTPVGWDATEEPKPSHTFDPYYSTQEYLDKIHQEEPYNEAEEYMVSVEAIEACFNCDENTAKGIASKMYDGMIAAGLYGYDYFSELIQDPDKADFYYAFMMNSWVAGFEISKNDDGTMTVHYEGPQYYVPGYGAVDEDNLNFIGNGGQ